VHAPAARWPNDRAISTSTIACARVVVRLLEIIELNNNDTPLDLVVHVAPPRGAVLVGDEDRDRDRHEYLPVASHKREAFVLYRFSRACCARTRTAGAGHPGRLKFKIEINIIKE
jgi:hypothetical protein